MNAEKRSTADNRFVYRMVNVGVILTAVAATLVSWQGLVFVGRWAELPERMLWLMPLMIDLPIVVFTLGGLARRSRGESYWLFSLAGYGLTMVSAIANFLHVVSIRGLGSLEGVAGSFLAALAPVLVLLTTEALGALLAKPSAAAADTESAAATVDALTAALERAGTALTASRQEIIELEKYRDNFGRGHA
ncbi:DUF2637 domain-containing protein [Pseudoclavibacter sp. CFCC 13796]|uniref:DUF2637 domain-containing protein n=1 Tax=Pseudoclavibacter sp. CFCC 13796 TaxID=2615179 RepID=UPI001300F49B|nr:DUF2637 domain-containing protein [Pseudoclavibacter sp. CFCC 13796]KAB1661647.1 DUF2637 domain-containing protein [Pseudoclavibacter sp. CFCC 13796]